MKTQGQPPDPNIVILAGGASSRMKAQAADAPDASLARDAREKPKGMIGVGASGRPFLDYLLYNIERAGYREAVIVVGDRDDAIRRYYKEGGAQFPGLAISYALQKIPEGRNKPLGTADALLAALRGSPLWRGKKLTVCNSDNLYSVRALRLLLEDAHRNALIDYDRSALRFPHERIEQFAVIRKNADGFLEDIVEKPNAGEIAQAGDSAGRIGVSMNIFRLSYEMILPCLETVPLHPGRQEQELPLAVKMMVQQHPEAVFAIPLAEHVPDLTTPSDIPGVQEELEKYLFSRE
jgi:glucose-1-phosphate adenylyltransferase